MIVVRKMNKYYGFCPEYLSLPNGSLAQSKTISCNSHSEPHTAKPARLFRLACICKGIQKGDDLLYFCFGEVQFIRCQRLVFHF